MDVKEVNMAGSGTAACGKKTQSHGTTQIGQNKETQGE